MGFIPTGVSYREVDCFEPDSFVYRASVERGSIGPSEVF